LKGFSNKGLSKKLMASFILYFSLLVNLVDVGGVGKGCTVGEGSGVGEGCAVGKGSVGDGRAVG